MASELAIPVKEFENALRKLGWLSAYSRQILMTRHLLRSLAAISHPEDVLHDIPGDFALDLFRCSITVLSGVNRESQQFSSPYDPINRPETHHLAYKRKKRIFSTSIASGMPDIHFHLGKDSGFGFENSTKISLEDELLCFEILTIAKNVSLTTKALADQRADALRNKKLWRDLKSEDQADALSFFDNWHEWAGKNGAFWREWYEGLLDGEPLDWELQRQVALIDDAIWEAGPDAVADEIEKIRSKFKLTNRIHELEADLRRVNTNRHGIGGNMPPEMPSETTIAQELIIVWHPLQELKEEITKDDPDPNFLQKIVDLLVAALRKGFAWGLQKGDLAIDSTIKWAIPAGGTAYFALNPEKLEAVIEAIKKLIGIL